MRNAVIRFPRALMLLAVKGLGPGWRAGERGVIRVRLFYCAIVLMLFVPRSAELGARKS